MRLVLSFLGFMLSGIALAVREQPVHFSEVSKSAGLKFVHHNGAFGRKYLPETMGSGTAFVDLDGDGWPEILLLNCKDWTPRGKRYLSALYRNNRDGTFTDVTAGSGLDIEMYAMGVAVADYDNDGRPDIYITALEGDHLFHNEGSNRFRDVTASSGIRNSNFGTSAAWFDYDRDGKADLFVADYIEWTPATDVWCSMDGSTKSYCTPESSKGAPCRLFHNLGNGRFEEVGKQAGIADPASKSLGVSILDVDNDGWPDIFVSNDTQPNKLYRNNHNGTFTERGVDAGVAYDKDGVARGAMGVDVSDYDRSGHQHILVGNFSNQMLGLYHNEGSGFFVDQAPGSSVGRSSLLSLTFGVFFFDFDLDGYPDIFAANGHTEVGIERIQPKVKYKEPPLMFRNLGKGRFEDVSTVLGPDFSRPILGRGAAHADFDHDGDQDIIVSTNNGPVYLYRNDGGNRNHWLNVRLVGSKSNRSGLDAVVRVQSASGRQSDTMRSGGSYCSQSDLAINFGLGNDDRVTRLEIDWPSGTHQKLSGIAADQFLTVSEDKGLLK